MNIGKALCASYIFMITGISTFVDRPVLPPECGPNTGVELRIMTDKLVYAPKSVMRVKFIVTNTGDVPLYFFRELNQCSSQLGSYFLRILDQRGKEVLVQRCYADLVLEQLDVIGWLNNPRWGILLRQRDVYGLEERYEVPAKKGAYRLEAELIPAGLLEKQLQALAEKQMRISPHCIVTAPVVTITVK